MPGKKGTRKPKDSQISISGEKLFEAIRGLTGAWIGKRGDEMARWLTEDIVEIGPTFEEPLRGKAAFFEKYEPYLSGSLEIVNYAMLQPSAVVLSERHALVYFGYRMVTRSGSEHEESAGKASMLLRNEGSEWRVQFIHRHRDK